MYSVYQRKEFNRNVKKTLYMILLLKSYLLPNVCVPTNTPVKT